MTGDKKELRSFGIVMAAAFTVLGALHSGIGWLRHGAFETPVVLSWIALLFLLFGLAAPRVLKPVFVVWMKFAEALHWFMTRLVLTIAYLLLFMPIRFIIQWFGNDPLKRTWQPSADTYWEEAEDQPDELSRYKNHY